MTIVINFVVDITEPSVVGNCFPIVSSFESFDEFKDSVRHEKFCEFVENFSLEVGVPKDFLYLYCSLVDGDYYKEFKINLK